MRIAPAALAAPGNDMRLVVRNVGKQPAALLLLNESSHRNADYKILGVFALAPAASAVFALWSVVFSFVAEIG